MPDGSSGWAAADAVFDPNAAERQLWCAVIGRALEDALGNVGAVSGDTARARAVEEARAWFSDNDEDFRRVCDAAGYDPDIVRSRALRLIAREATVSLRLVRHPSIAPCRERDHA